MAELISSTKKLRSDGRDSDNAAESQEGTAGGSGSAECSAQDQVILAPEIMRKILKELDMRSLKSVRLVCKSWLLEAQVHLEKRGIIRLYREFCTTRIRTFIENNNFRSTTPARLNLSSLSVEVDLYHGTKDPHRRLSVSQLLRVSPPLLITRLIPWSVPLNAIIPLLLQCSPTLKYLRVLATEKACGTEHMSLMDPSRQCFPKLRHLVLDINNDNQHSDPTNFPSIFGWIANLSPNLETYELDIFDESNKEFITALLTQVESSSIANVKNLTFRCSALNAASLKHFSSVPFTQLQHLRLTLLPDEDEDDRRHVEISIATVAKSSGTLKELDLMSLNLDMSFYEKSQMDFPVCPILQELHVLEYPCFNSNLVATHFPSLKVLNAFGIAERDFSGDWKLDLSPLPNLKCLRIKFFGGPETSEDFVEKLFSKFPALECLCVDYTAIDRLCSLKASGNPRFSNFLEGIKNLELYLDDDLSTSQRETGYSFLAVLKGIETIAVLEVSPIITSIPVKELPSLKVIQFPWGNCFDLAKLLEMAKGVPKILIDNCCSITRTGSSRSNALLKEFFESATNAECGCKHPKRLPESLSPRLGGSAYN